MGEMEEDEEESAAEEARGELQNALLGYRKDVVAMPEEVGAPGLYVHDQNDNGTTQIYCTDTKLGSP